MNEVATIPVYVAGVGVVIINNGKILMGNRKDNQGWCLPGGKRDITDIGFDGPTYETRRKAMERELWEEFGLLIPAAHFCNECVIFSRAKVSGEYCNVYSQIYSYQYDVPEENLPVTISEDEFLEYRWVDQYEFHQLPIIFIPSLVAVNIVMSKRWDFEAQIRSIEREEQDD